jgi:hypothetical protein
MSILQAFIICQHFGMNIDVENMERYLTVYNFGFICCKLALYCETIICLQDHTLNPKFQCTCI